MTKVTLTEALTIDGGSVKKIQLRRPMGGDLRGLKLTELLQLDVTAVSRLVPRISTPPVSETQMAAMGAADITKLATGVVGFFVDPAELETK